MRPVPGQCLSQTHKIIKVSYDNFRQGKTEQNTSWHIKCCSCFVFFYVNSIIIFSSREILWWVCCIMSACGQISLLLGSGSGKFNNGNSHFEVQSPSLVKTNKSEIKIAFETYFICFTIVLFPDSPAPVGTLKKIQRVTKETQAVVFVSGMKLNFGYGCSGFENMSDPATTHS